MGAHGLRKNRREERGVVVKLVQKPPKEQRSIAFETPLSPYSIL
jgi:hypothetical protein